MRFLKIASCATLLCGLAAVPAANAQPAPPPGAGPAMGGHHHMMPGWGKGHGGMHRGRGFDLIGFGCGPRAAERLEIAFVRLSHRVELTDTQKPLFETLKTTALTEQTKVADACAAAMPAKEAAEKPDVIDHMKARLAVDTARVAALEKVMPDLEAFYATLTDEQKADLTPRRKRMHLGMTDQDEGMPPAPHGKRPPAGKAM